MVCHRDLEMRTTKAEVIHLRQSSFASATGNRAMVDREFRSQEPEWNKVLRQIQRMLTYNRNILPQMAQMTADKIQSAEVCE